MENNEFTCSKCGKSVIVTVRGNRLICPNCGASYDAEEHYAKMRKMGVLK